MGPGVRCRSFVLPKRVQEVRPVQDQRSRSSARHVRTQRSMIAFMRGTRTPVFTMTMPSVWRIASKAAVCRLSLDGGRAADRRAGAGEPGIEVGQRDPQGAEHVSRVGVQPDPATVIRRMEELRGRFGIIVPALRF
jgi:hypothetical protein